MTARFDFPIILLAAGASRRMRGRDKLLEYIGDEPLLRVQARRARAATTAQVLVALPSLDHPRATALQGLDVHLVAVPDASAGMSASLRRSVAALPEEAPCAMILLADLPDLTVEDLKKVGQAIDLTGSNQIWRGATQDGRPGHPIVFQRALFPAFKGLTGDEGARAIVATAKGHVALVPLPADHALADLDTPEDWAAWRAAGRS